MVGKDWIFGVVISGSFTELTDRLMAWILFDFLLVWGVLWLIKGVEEDLRSDKGERCLVLLRYFFIYWRLILFVFGFIGGL